jgi:hypothetical protein
MTAEPKVKPLETAEAEDLATPIPDDQKTISEQLDAEEAEFRAVRRDLQGVKGTSAAGIVTIGLAKLPAKNEFFRTHREFRPIVPIVTQEVAREQQYFVVTADMVEALSAIGITVADHTLYFTVTTRGAYRICPVRQANADGEQNEYNRTREICLIRGMDEWVRLYHDDSNSCYQVFPAPADRYGEPQFPDLKAAKIFRLAFRDKGRLIDSVEHPLFKKWTARTELPFTEIWLHDFEFIARPGEHPDVVCLAAHEIRAHLAPLARPAGPGAALPHRF